MKKDNQTGHHSRAEIGKRESSDSQPYQKVRRAEGFNDGVGSRDQKEIGKKQKSQLFFTGFDADKPHYVKVNNKLAWPPWTRRSSSSGFLPPRKCRGPWSAS